jgi:serine/threonine protein kinase
MSNAVPAGPSADRNLLFGVLALQADLLDAARFAEACTAWSARKDTPLASLLVERGWLTPEDRQGVEQFLERKLNKHAGDVRASLAEVLSDPVRQTLSNVADPVVHHTLSALRDSGDGVHEKATVNYKPVGRERYTLTRLHARGGIGQVWVARDGDLGREVALKELLGGGADSPAVVARFVEEAQITGQLQHPNIVPVYELVRPADPGKGPFYTMRFVRGRTLAAAIKQYHEKRRGNEAGPLELRELLNYFVAVCNAVAYAHSRGVLHRDLKPGNIVLGDFGEVIVLDWGLAKLKGAAEERTSLLPVTVNTESSRGETVQGQAIGTPSYMPPEQAEGRIDLVEERSDVYGLGAILYEILVGTPPFDGPDTLNILAQVLVDEPLVPRQKVPRTPRALEAVCLKALAKKQANRYGSVKELSRDVERWLGDEPVSASPEPLLTKAGRWVKRHRQSVSVAAAILLVSVPLLVLLAANREQARRQAEIQREENRQQREIAEANAKTATEREAETRAVLDFVQNRILSAARPEGLGGGLGREVPLRQAVEAARPFVAQSFRAQPLIEAGLRHTMGLSYLYLSEPKTAEAELQASLAIHADRLGPDHPDTLADMYSLACAYTDLGREGDALHLHEETLRQRERVLGRDHPDTLTSMHALGNCCETLGRNAEALKLREETLKRRTAVLGPGHVDTLQSVSALSNSYERLNRVPETLKLREELLPRLTAALGRDHPDTLKCMQNLASSYSDVGKGTEALKLREESLAILKSKLGPDHRDTLRFMSQVAVSYVELGRLADGLKLNEETLALRRAKFGPDHPDTLASMNNVGVCNSRLGRRAEALKIFEETLALRQAKLGPNHPHTLESMYNIACEQALMVRKAADPRKQADLAMESLKKAVAAGFKYLDAIKQDSDLEALHSREDFKKLIADLEKETAIKKE